MNPIRWLLNLSAAAAKSRGGDGAQRPHVADPKVDDRDDQEWLVIDGATFFNGNKKMPEIWRELSSDGSRFARVTVATDGSFRLNVYERLGGTWGEFEGPSVMASLAEAQALARKLTGVVLPSPSW